MSDDSTTKKSNFIRQIIDRDNASGKHGGRVATRFPPEPNGYLHIGHAKSICLNFGVARDYGGTCNLRFDDTNPEKEDLEFSRAIERDIRWLGFEWEELLHASDYFEQLYQYAEELISKDLAYVDQLSAEEMRQFRGTLKEPGRNSPYRDRPVEESMDLFRRMRAGEFEDGEMVLRAKIDMAAPNINMRDPVIYRIKRMEHQRSGDAWCIYPMYDFTHCISDALEGITHSLCTLEFEDHRPLYDWVLDNITVDCHPQQIEFARLDILYAVTSKRKLKQLVDEGHVEGWDDPRMVTLSGIRRRGYPPDAIREFCDRIGISKAENKVELSVLEGVARDSLSHSARRVMAVLKPIKVVLTNYPEGQVEEMECPYHPQRPELGSRKMPFSRELYIEQDDFMEDPPRKYFRLKPGGAVRLRYGYIIDCQEVIKDDNGQVVELRCTYDPDTRSGTGTSDRKVKGTIHWVSADHAVDATVRVYDRLFVRAQPADGKEGKDFLEYLNPDSLEVLTDCKLEASMSNVQPEDHFQFERLGYFVADVKDHQPDAPVFNRTVSLRDSWAKIEQQQKQGG
ncbi:MAG: glutamine--tRNA ligase/YqeY domain fusion protein [Xanthomonadales bacterium]|nr:glutamine--tRNA ligase/YqeY domain fusion protein [Xanthomonadales bacterium]